MTTRTALAALALCALAAAAPVAAAPLYATDVVWSGGTLPDGKTSARRNDADNALGATDGKFLSIGLGGWAELSFGQPFTGPGSAVEVTWGRKNYFESVDVFGKAGGKAGGKETLIAKLSNQTNEGISAFDFSGIYTSLVFRDTSAKHGGRDGFDIDAVSVSAVPVPAAGLLLGAALGAGGLLRARRRA